MPTYEYLCKDCDLKFEEFQSIAAEPLHICPRCGGSVRRLISAGGGIIFKGSGFYETDYKRKEWSRGAESKSATTVDTASSTKEPAKSATPPKDE
ncbi:MAG: zinc ribbon domain-containing protein [bacterium]